MRGVYPDYAVNLTETLPFGVERVNAYGLGSPGGAYQAGYRGATARIAIIDTGIDLTHPDLAAHIDVASGKNCVDPSLPPDDGHGHGTHVAGTAAAPVNGIGVVGVAPQGSLVYDPSATGVIGFAGDTDNFTLNVDPGQTITVLVTANTASSCDAWTPRTSVGWPRPRRSLLVRSRHSGNRWIPPNER